MSSQLQVTGEAKIRDIQGPVVANSGVITALDGAASQYVRGDGTLADFPTSSGGGSSVSYYLNSSVSQGTIGGVAYRELSKDPIIGAGTDIAISSNGYVANYLTDANDPDVTIVPGGNFNCEFYFSVNNNSGNPTTYAELYKYDGTTFTLLGSNVGVPESINQGTTIAPYYFAIPVPTSALALTDRLAIRIYVNVGGRTVTLHTENGHLCQVVTTLSKGMVSLNNLTDQSQFLATGTSGTNFAIVSSGDTHTFNLPIASASNTGKLSSTDWSTFNNKQNALTNPITGTGASGNVAYFDGTTSITAENSFNYDASTNRLGVNTTVPNATIGANAALDSGYSLLLKNDNANYNSIGFATDSTYGNMITADRVGAAPSRNLTLYNYAGFVSITEAGNLGIGLLTPNNGIDIYHATQSQLWLHNNATGVSSTDGVRLALFNSKEANLRNFDGAMSISAEGDFSVITIGAENFRINSTDGSIYQSKVANAILKSVSGVITAAVANTDYQAPITLTTTGSSGPATLSGSTLNIPDYSTNTTNFVTIGTTQTVTGTKTFNEAIRNESGLLLKNGAITGLAGYTSLSGSISNGLVVQLGGSFNQQTLSFQTGGAYSYTFPAASGTLALTSDLSSYVPTSRTLTINGETYDLSANRTWTISGITGSGAVGRVAYWNGTSSVTSEAAFNYDDNLNRLGVNTNSPNATIGANSPTDSNYSLLLKNSDTNYSGIGFATSSTYGNTIETVRIGTAPSRNLTLYNYAGFISLTEAGNLGVGILTPNTGIDIYHSTISSLWLHTAASGTSGTDGVRLFLSSNSNAVLRNNEGSLSMSSESDFYVITLGAENIRVNSANGYVGIGNPTTLTSILTVNGAITQSSVTSAILKANASGTLVAAVAGTDYVAPSGLSGYVPTSRTITINGDTQNLTADSSYTVGTLRGNGVAGRIPFYDGTQTFSNSANLIWDDTNGYLGVNNTPQIPLDVLGAGFNVSGTTMNIVARFLKDKSATFNGIGLGYDTSSRTGIIYADTASGPSNIAFWTYNTSYAERMRITGAGNVGIGTNNPQTRVQINDSGAGAYTMLTIHNRQSRAAGVGARINLLPNSDFTAGVDTGAAISAVNSSGNVNNDTNLIFETSSTGTGAERMRITSTGVVELNAADATYIRYSYLGTTKALIGVAGATSDIISGAAAGELTIRAQQNMLFSSGGDTERMRINTSGVVMIGTTNDNPAENNVKGVSFFQDGRQFISSMDNEVMRINRGVSDGVLVFFHQAGVAEGNISVSGTTVSYNGGHLSRYSQTETYQRIEGLLKGTVMSNLDKMAEWIDPKTGEPYANEQLNCMKISDIEGDVNVAGVFVNWDDDDKSFTSDMNIAMTGDMIIRIAQGVVVEKGQLLMSAGDGTAKPQEDDIIRSKTVAKVTSNYVTCTYEDGSYCVPCVLMAC